MADEVERGLKLAAQRAREAKAQEVKQDLAIRVAVYKRLISPMLPHACRFVPTCSEYAMEAVERHGVLRGSMLAAWRLLRCHPFARRIRSGAAEFWEFNRLQVPLHPE